MTDKTKGTGLFSEFPPVSAKEWKDKIIADLKDADYEKKLVWKTPEAISVKPYYRAEDLDKLEYLNVHPGEFPFVRGNKKDNNNWDIRQDIEELFPEKANRIALNIISRGAEAIGFNAKEIDNSNDMKMLLNGIDLTKVSVHFTSASSYLIIYNLFIEEIKRQNLDTRKIKGSFNFDSLSYFLPNGKFNASQDNNFIEAASLVSNVNKNLPSFKAITVNGQYFHNAGASIVQELAFSLSSANEYLVQLTNKGIITDNITPAMQFVFASGSSYFMEIAKLRAARILWAKIVEQYNPKKETSLMMNIHIVTSLWNKSVYDPYVNMLRSTTEAMSAAIGGCDSMTVNPFDITYKKSDEFSERIAQNTQLILKAESYLDKIVDPSAGSYYIENLTHSIVEAAWNYFLVIEGKGGFIKAVETGFIKEVIEKTCQKRDMDIAMRKQIVLGTNQYPNQREK